jgi:anthranilate synthase component 1
MYNLSLEQARDLGATAEGNLLPITTELFGDRHTPITVLEALKKESPRCYLLESVDGGQKWGRYSFLGFDPVMQVSCIDHRVTIVDRNGTVETEEDPTTVLRRILSERKSIPLPSLPPFTGGLVGYFSYDYCKYPEPSLHLQGNNDERFKDLELMLFDTVICFDNFRQKIILVANAPTEDIDAGYRQAIGKLERIRSLITDGKGRDHEGGNLLGPMEQLLDERQFCTMVRQAKEHIVDGDIFQVVLSNRSSAPFEGSLLDTYRYLRTSNPSPYMVYLCGYDVEVACSSPETLAKLENGVLRTFPLAGTRPRGSSETEDHRLAFELLSDEKELAEHTMLVDLGRNDLGKICEFGSVKPERIMSVELFSHVMHIGSTVRGTPKAGKDALDAIEAVLPAGTLSGAPKIRACEIIDKAEGHKRGIYGGAIGYIGFNGNMDTCIAIRIAYRKEGRVYVCSGAGIVADSDPHAEYRECQNKAKAVVEALASTSGGMT